MSESTTDPSTLHLIQRLAWSLLMHHAGYTTLEPYARTYDRDRHLINQAETLLVTAEGVSQSWRSEPLAPMVVEALS